MFTHFHSRNIIASSLLTGHCCCYQVMMERIITSVAIMPSSESGKLFLQSLKFAWSALLSLLLFFAEDNLQLHSSSWRSVTIYFYQSSPHSLHYQLHLGKPSLKKTIFLLTFVNKRFTPPPKLLTKNHWSSGVRSGGAPPPYKSEKKHCLKTLFRQF